jgi:hypothetical protein
VKQAAPRHPVDLAGFDHRRTGIDQLYPVYSQLHAGWPGGHIDTYGCCSCLGLFHPTFELDLRLTRLFEEEGVRIVAGTDLGGALREIPGYALDQEVDLLAEDGLCRSASSRARPSTTPSSWEVRHLLGAVEVGKASDLVVLHGNPLESVANLHGVAAVVRRGRHLSGADLEALRESAERDSAV